MDIYRILMVGSVNKTILLGNLGRDPEIRSMQSGAKMASFSIATSKRWKDRNTQEQKEKTSWHNIVVFGDGLVDIVEKYVTVKSGPIVVYPNPTANTFTIETRLNIQIEVHDLMGKLLIKTKNINRLDLSDLSSGLYNLSIIHEEKRYNKQIIKQ